MICVPRHKISAKNNSLVDRAGVQWAVILSAALVWMFSSPCFAAAPRSLSCIRVDFTDMVNMGQEWKAPLGEGWVFRIVPIVPGADGYTGWDLVVDRLPPAGYPDALLLATPPYNSLNEREIGNTFGLRAQDAIGWNPRSFHFLTNATDLSEGQKLLQTLTSLIKAQPQGTQKEQADPNIKLLTDELMALGNGAASGQLRILDAGLAPGMADPAPFARNWSQQASQTSYILVPQSSGTQTARGELDWIRFSLTLWLPGTWKPAPGLKTTPEACPR